MNRSIAPRHPFKALLAVAAMAALAHGTCARAATPDDVSRVDVVGTMALHDACDVDNQALADELATAWRDAPSNSDIKVDFKVQGPHVFDVSPHTPSRRTYHQIRRVVHGMRCNGGDEQAHAVHFVVRFIDKPESSPVASRVAIADATSR